MGLRSISQECSAAARTISDLQLTHFETVFHPEPTMFTRLEAGEFDLTRDYASPYESSRDTYLKAAKALKLATGPYKAARDAYVAATATYTKSLYE
jgi:hypothetical protein